MQNSYNNFLKRQKQTSTNNFKEKIVNSLSGKALNNTTMPNTANKVNTLARSTTQAPTSPSKLVQPVNNINTQQVIKTPPIAQNTAQNTTPENTINTQPQTTPQVPQEVVNGASQQVVDAPVEGATGQGMMSLADINSAMAIGGETQVANNPYARTTSTTTSSTDNNYKDLLEQNKNAMIEQANKGWEAQQEAYKSQMESLKADYEQSKIDAENAYKDTVDELVNNRYNQMEDLNVSGTNRGLQYSPQQLGLENVVNINHNKNLVQASKKRNELLNSLQIQMNKALAELNISMINSQNEHNRDLLNITTNFNDKLINWGRDDYLTQQDREWQKQQEEERRKWEEEQKKQQQEYDKLMQELQNKFDKEMQDSQNNWQSGENKLDREHETALSKSRSTGGGYSNYGGYSGGYGGYSKNYNPYSRGYYNGWNSYDGGEVNAQALEDEITQQAIDNKFKQLSTDVYNAVDTGGVYDLMERADIYSNSVSPMYDTYYGLNSIVDERLDNTKETALKHLVNKSIARSTNGSYNIGDTVYQHKAPLRQSYIDKVKNTKERTANKVYQKHSKNPATKFKSNVRANAESMHEKIMSGSSNKTSSKSSSKDVKRPNKITTKYQTSVQKVNSSKTNKSNSKTTTKKTTAPKKTTTKNTKYQTSTQKLNSNKKNTSSSKKVTMTKKTNSSSKAKKYTTSTQKVSSSAKKTSSKKTTKKEGFLSKLKKKLTKK